jgi:CHAT domain-containing protein/tetratricopeptide (TPR) repeat protein
MLSLLLSPSLRLWLRLRLLLGMCLLVLLPSTAQGALDRLKPGEPQERELAAGESHSYRFELDQGRYFYLYAVQQNIDLRLVLRDPSGEEVQTVDDQFLRGRHPENLVWISQRTGEYEIEVQGVVGKGRYRLVWDSQWDVEATEDLRRRTPADRLYYRGLGLQQRPEHRYCRTAIEVLEQTLDTWVQVGDLAQEASTLNNIGYCLNRLGEYLAAAESLESSLQIMPQTLATMRAQSLQNLAFSNRHLGRFEEAEVSYREVISIFHTQGKRLDEGKGFSGLGSTLKEKGELEAALESFRQARQLFEEVGSGHHLASALNSIAATLTHLGRVDEALTLLEEAGRLADPRDRMGAQVRAAVAANLGSIYDWVGEPALALRHFESSIEQNLTLGDRLGEARVRRQLGILYRDLGELEAALEELGLCAALHIALGRVRDVAEVQVLVADVYRRQGDLKVATAIIDFALPTVIEAGRVVDRVEALEKKGLLLEGLGQFRGAREIYQEALGLVDRLQDTGRQGRLEAAAGASALRGGNPRRAQRHLTSALHLSRASRDQETEVESLVSLARLERQSGELELASQHVGDALEVIERVRDRVGGEHFRVSYLERQWAAYALGVDLLASRHRQRPSKGYDLQAFHLSEKMRSRALQDLALVSRADLRKGVREELLTKEQGLRRQLNAREHFLLTAGRLPVDRRRKVAKEIDSILRRLHDTQAMIFGESPSRSRQNPVEMLSVREIQQQLLGEDTVLLEFLLGEERSLVWALTGDSFRMAELPPGEELESMALELRRLLTLPAEQRSQQALEEHRAWGDLVFESERQYVEVGGRLSRALLAPVMDLLDGRRLVVVADGALRLLPFGALPEPGSKPETWQPLMARRAVLSAPSASTIGALRRQRATRQEPDRLLAVFADPVLQRYDPRVAAVDAGPEGSKDDLEEKVGALGRRVPLAGNLASLPHSRKEAEALLRLAKGRGETLAALGFKASRDHVFDGDLGRYRYLVFATHAVMDDRWPELSGIVLSTLDHRGKSRPGYLALHDIYDLELSADLVVLSACETAVGRAARGEGLLSLARGFLQAGAAQVLASLWRVDDQATARLMERVNQGLLAQDLDPEDALRRAVTAFREDPRNARRGHPYYWAGFVVIGDWR